MHEEPDGYDGEVTVVVHGRELPARTQVVIATPHGSAAAEATVPRRAARRSAVSPAA